MIRPNIFAQLAAGVLGLVGLLALLGWVFDVTALKSVLPGWSMMAPLTAVNFMMSAVSLWFTVSSKEVESVQGGPRPLLRISQVCAVLVVVVGCYRLGDYVFGWASRLEMLGFHDTFTLDGSPAQLALSTALAFILIGGALVLAGRQRVSVLFQPLALLTALIGCLGVLRYVYGGEPLQPYSPMSAITAFCFLLLSCGVLCARTDSGLMTLILSADPGSALMWRLLPLVGALTFTIGWLRLKAQQAGWFGTEAGISLFALSNFIMFSALVWATAVLLKRTEGKRRQANHELEAAFKESSDLKAALDEHAIVARTDAKGKITFVNDKFCAISKYSRDELIGKDHRIINSGFHSKEFIRDLWTTITHGKVWHGEIKNRAKDGTFYWVDTTIVPFLNENGKPRQYIAIRADITERKRFQEQLRASYNELSDFKTALDEHAIVALTDSRGRITYVNDKFCAISKYSRDELIGQDHRIINSGYHPAEFIRGIWTTIGHGKVWHGEIKNRAKDGTFYWVDTTIVPFLGEDGKPRQYVAIRADITERKQMELAARESQERFRTMANSMSQLAWIAQPDGSIFWYNRRWYEYTGTTPEQMEGWGWQSVHDPEVLPKVIAGWTAAISEGRAFEMEFPLRGADGKFRTFLTRGQPLKNSEERVVQWFGTNTDVDELRQAKEKVSQLNTELEHRVAERTAQLEAANKELEAFSYSVSHDLRAPLRAMNGFAGIVLEEFGPQIPPEAVRYLGRIRNGGVQMGQLIDDLLAFSRLSRLPFNRQAVDMEIGVKNVLEDLAEQREGRAIEITTAPLPGCRGDPALLKQVWTNLISNAVKYTRGREPAVIKIGCELMDGENVYFVCDNGTGFDMQYAGKLFGVFQRLHRADEFEGTGVGLAIVQRVVHRHGGRVWVEAELGKGATFRFTLGKEKTL